MVSCTPTLSGRGALSRDLHLPPFPARPTVHVHFHVGHLLPASPNSSDALICEAAPIFLVFPGTCVLAVPFPSFLVSYLVGGTLVVILAPVQTSCQPWKLGSCRSLARSPSGPGALTTHAAPHPGESCACVTCSGELQFWWEAPQCFVLDKLCLTSTQLFNRARFAEKGINKKPRQISWGWETSLR